MLKLKFTFTKGLIKQGLINYWDVYPSSVLERPPRPKHGPNIVKKRKKKIKKMREQKN